MSYRVLPVKRARLVALSILLSLALVAGMVIFADAAPTGKADNVHIIGSGRIELTWKSGQIENYSVSLYVSLGGLRSARLFPSRGWHVETFSADGKPVDFIDEDGDVTIYLSAFSPKLVDVTFMENGGVDDVNSNDLVAYPDPDVGVTFAIVDEVGYVFASTIGLQQIDQVGESWDIRTDGDWFSGPVTIELVLRLSDIPVGVNPRDLKLSKTEIVPGDVNFDGVVDGDDVSDIGNHNPSKLGEPNYDPRYDIAEPKNIIDNEDVNKASHNIGMESIWTDLTTDVNIDNDNDLVYYSAVTEGLDLPIDPIFGVH